MLFLTNKNVLECVRIAGEDLDQLPGLGVDVVLVPKKNTTSCEVLLYCGLLIKKEKQKLLVFFSSRNSENMPIMANQISYSKLMTPMWPHYQFY